MGWWTTKQRGEYRKDTLAADRVVALEATDSWTWDWLEQAWTEGFEALRTYVAEFGTASVVQNYVTTDGMRLGNWASSQRAAWHRGRLPEERGSALMSLHGWVWTSWSEAHREPSGDRSQA